MRSSGLILAAAFLGTVGNVSIASAQGNMGVLNPDFILRQPNQQFFMQQPAVDPAAINRLYLGCSVLAEERGILITNTRQAPITQSTPIWFDVVDQFSGQHDLEYIYAPALAPGASFEIAIKRVASCTAWLDWQPVMAPD